jgi:NDP-sugar pyrophosphorylase family protein
MKAVILAAGKGTRMRDLTNELPKPMLQTHGKPILEHIVDGLAENGIREIFIVTGFRAETIENYFGDGSAKGLTIRYGRQLVQDGTGKAPEIAKEFAGADSFLLTYGDILVKPETYRRMIERWTSGAFDGLATATIGRDDVAKGGLLLLDKDFLARRVVEKPSPAEMDDLRRRGEVREGDPLWYNAGIYIFQPVLFEFTARLQKSPRGEFELTDAINGMLAAGKTIAGVEIQGRWVDVRDPETLAALEQSRLAE